MCSSDVREMCTDFVDENESVEWHIVELHLTPDSRVGNIWVLLLRGERRFFLQSDSTKPLHIDEEERDASEEETDGDDEEMEEEEIEVEVVDTADKMVILGPGEIAEVFLF